MPIHICHVVLSLRPGGLENGVVNVVNGLDPDRFRSTVVCLQEAGDFARRIRGDAASIIEMGLRPGNDFAMPFRLARTFRELKADVVHTRNAEACFYGIAGAKMSGVRATIHSEHGRDFPEKWHRAWLQRRLLSGVTCSFAVSECLKRELVKEIGLSPDRLRVLYSGVDTAKFSPGTKAGAARDRNEIVIGSVGRLVEVKNYPLLVRALARLSETVKCRMVLVGSGPMEQPISDLAGELGVSDRLTLLGHSDEISALMQGFDIFVLPSFNEGVSNTLLEAMAAGVSIVASDVGGTPELLRNGRDGLLFRSGDVEQLVGHLARLSSDESLRKSLADSARQRVQAEFSMASMLSRYEQLYQEAVWGAHS
jgi:sugar transferase (PEP-CTERM/EpsH1 system associated)